MTKRTDRDMGSTGEIQEITRRDNIPKPEPQEDPKQNLTALRELLARHIGDQHDVSELPADIKAMWEFLVKCEEEKQRKRDES